MRHKLGILCCLIVLSLGGCAVTPVEQEISLPSQVLGNYVPVEGQSLIVFYNDSNELLYGLDSSGKINISLDGRGVGQVSINEYVAVEMPMGSYLIELAHRDMVNFNSDHTLEADEGIVYVKIYAKMTSNGLEITPKPATFAEEFFPAY